LPSMRPLPGHVPLMARRVSRSQHPPVCCRGSGLSPEGALPRYARRYSLRNRRRGRWLSTPKVALLILLALPVFDGVTSERLTEQRLHLQFGKAVAELCRRGKSLGRCRSRGQAISLVRPTRAVCKAASQSSHIVGSTGIHQGANEKFDSSLVLPWRRQIVSKKMRIAS
jgi:hypothetical protein